MPMWDAGNMFLNGPFEPLHTVGDHADLAVRGHIPEDLEGTLYRVGSSQLFEPVEPSRYHWFDGDGMVYEVRLGRGWAGCRNRYVSTAGLEGERAAGRALYPSFMNGGAVQARPEDAPPVKNPANTNIMKFAGRLLVFCEADVPHELDVETLDTRGSFDFGGGASGPVTAHFKVDPDNGDLLFFGAMGPAITWYRADRNGRILQTLGLDMGLPSFIHDFTVTRDYAIFFLNPSLVSFESVMQGGPSTIWAPEHGNRILLLHRASGESLSLPIDDVFAPTHFLNAYRDGRSIVVDGNRADSFGARVGERNPFTIARPWRWLIEPDAGRVTHRPLAGFNAEFPRINDRYCGKRHRYGYYAANESGGFCEDWLFDAVAKLDVETGRAEFNNLGGRLRSPGEVVFVPRREAAAEDDGYILSLWWNPEENVTDLVILDAQDFAGEPLATVRLPHRIPMTFHGNWSPKGG